MYHDFFYKKIVCFINIYIFFYIFFCFHQQRKNKTKSIVSCLYFSSLINETYVWNDWDSEIDPWFIPYEKLEMGCFWWIEIAFMGNIFSWVSSSSDNAECFSSFFLAFWSSKNQVGISINSLLIYFSLRVKCKVRIRESHFLIIRKGYQRLTWGLDVEQVFYLKWKYFFIGIGIIIFKYSFRFSLKTCFKRLFQVIFFV